MRVAFDVIGSGDKAVAIIEPKKDESPKEIAADIMRRHKNVKSVLAKTSGRQGKFRTYKLKLIAGDKNTEVLHKEHGMVFKLDPQKVYFSPRESQERQSVANLVKPNERVLVLFSGAGPFAIAIANRQPSAQVIAVDANRAAIKCADENRKLNRAWNVQNICADATKFMSKDEVDLSQHSFSRAKTKFDRIIMPLPETAWKFLPDVKKLAKKGAVIHLYAIGSDAKNLEDIDEKIPRGLKIISREKVLPFAPHKWKIRIDLKYN